MKPAFLLKLLLHLFNNLRQILELHRLCKEHVAAATKCFLVRRFRPQSRQRDDRSSRKRVFLFIGADVLGRFVTVHDRHVDVPVQNLGQLHRHLQTLLSCLSNPLIASSLTE